MTSQDQAQAVAEALTAELPATFHLIRDQRPDRLNIFIQPHGRRLPKFFVEVWPDEIITMEVSGSVHGHTVHSLNHGPFAPNDVAGLIAYFQQWLTRNIPG